MSERARGQESGRGGRLRDLRAGAATMAGKAVYAVLRAAGRSATTLPGRIALSLDPSLLSRLARRHRILMVTGTNGKTTTARMMTGILRRYGHTVVDNPAGANMNSGLATALLTGPGASRKAPAGGIDLFAVLEVDEAAFAAAAVDLAPEVCIVTNIFRDQLDRYGERDAMRALIARGLADAVRSREGNGISTVVLCADDPLCESLGDPHRSNPRVRLIRTGMDPADMQPGGGDGELPGEAAHCPDCQTRYRYHSVAYAHLGDYACPACGRVRPRPEVVFRVPDPVAEQQAVFAFADPAGGPGRVVATPMSIPGVHNLYNAAGALAAVTAVGIPFERACALLGEVTPAFGRMERMELEGRTVWMILVKNPVGMDRALDHVCAAPDAGALFMLLNSADADGCDTSWIWDARFEDRELPGPLFVSGRRVWDMALRLRYAGRPSATLRADGDAGRMLAEALAACPPDKALYVLPNYTAMLELRAGALRQYGVTVFGEGGDPA